MGSSNPLPWLLGSMFGDPGRHRLVADPNEGGDIADGGVDIPIVEGSDGLLNFPQDVVLTQPVAILWLCFALPHQLHVLEVVPPLGLEEVDDHDTMVELSIGIATEGHGR